MIHCLSKVAYMRAKLISCFLQLIQASPPVSSNVVLSMVMVLLLIIPCCLLLPFCGGLVLCTCFAALFVVSYQREYVHEVLVKCFVKLAQEKCDYVNYPSQHDHNC